MYQAFEAIIRKGKIKPIEQVRLKESTHLLITVLGGHQEAEVDWKAFRKWFSGQRKGKKYTRHATIDAAKRHLDLISRQ